MPGKSYSYTQNFPYEPLLGNGPSGEALLWSALSLITLLAGTGVVLLAFGRFDFLGWKGRDSHVHPQLLPDWSTSSQRATLKFFVVVALLFLVQVLIGAGLAHYRAQPDSFYGFDLAAYLPSNLLRTWHLQSGIFWIVTAYVGGGLFLADALGSREPRRQVRGIDILWAGQRNPILLWFDYEILLQNKKKPFFHPHHRLILLAIIFAFQTKYYFCNKTFFVSS